MGLFLALNIELQQTVVDELANVLLFLCILIGEVTYAGLGEQGPENPLFWVFVLVVLVVALWQRKAILGAPRAVRKVYRKFRKARARRAAARAAPPASDEDGDSDEAREKRRAVVVSFADDVDLEPVRRGDASASESDDELALGLDLHLEEVKTASLVFS